MKPKAPFDNRWRAQPLVCAFRSASSPMHPRLRHLLPAMLCLLPLTPARADDTPTFAIGAGMQRMPSWTGARTTRNTAIPFIDIELPQYGFALSTDSGLQWDLIRGAHLHGGIDGDYQWGRDRDDLGMLGGKLPTLSPRVTGGGYLEWDFNPQWDIGMHTTHDTQGAGAYLDVYAEWDPPKIGLLDQSLQLRWQAMNGAAMRRFFGIGPASAQALAVPAWQPGGGSQLAEVEYDLFLPTSRHTGLATSIEYGRLLGNAASSPLVQRYGSRNQLTLSLAFVYHP